MSGEVVVVDHAAFLHEHVVAVQVEEQSHIHECVGDVETAVVLALVIDLDHTSMRAFGMECHSEPHMWSAAGQGIPRTAMLTGRIWI